MKNEEPILIPKFELGEPNIASALKRNAEGLCSYHKCDNKLGDSPQNGFLGLKICDSCREGIDRMLAEISRETTKQLTDLNFLYNDSECKRGGQNDRQNEY